ncbi:hypothetical protein CGH27_17630, partial [Vibrio parahaemolyticus]
DFYQKNSHLYTAFGKRLQRFVKTVQVYSCIGLANILADFGSIFVRTFSWLNNRFSKRACALIKC